MLRKTNMIVLILSLVICGCGTQKTESSGEAIEISKTLETTQQKVTYLIKQAEAFYSSKEFQATVDITQYILQYLDKDSQKAKDLFNKAKDALISQAESTLEGVKEKFGM